MVKNGRRSGRRRWRCSVLAGMIIGLAAFSNISVGGGVEGAFLFSFGLLTVLDLELKLFTGAVGREKNWKTLTSIWFGNVFGVSLLGFGLGLGSEIVVRNSDFFASVLCGMLMFVAARKGKSLVSILCVMCFVVSGYSHCIVEAFYWGFNGWVGFGNVLISTVGNVVGCLFMGWMLEEEEEEKEIL